MADNNDDATRVIRLADISDLDCGICCEPLRRRGGMLGTCEGGHTHYCMTCFIEKCPMCKHSHALHNETLEGLLDSIHVSCKNKNKGCTVVSSYASCMEHEKYCEYGVKICPMVMDCGYTGTEDDLAKHVIFDHLRPLGRPPDDNIYAPSISVTSMDNLKIWKTEIEVDNPDSCFPLYNGDTRELLFLFIQQGRAWVCAPRSMSLSFHYTLKCGGQKFSGFGSYYTPTTSPSEVFILPPGFRNVKVKIKLTDSE